MAKARDSGRPRPMQHWLLKSEPATWSWQDQLARGERGETWDGVRNHQAANFLRQMRPGDQAFFYHSGRERAIVGLVEVVDGAFPDPSDPSGRFVAVTVRASAPVEPPVSLARMKAAAGLSDFLLLRQSRLSVMPVTPAQWRLILALRGA